MTRKTLITADLHLGHKGIIDFCDRPFSSVLDMDEEIVWRWNTVVKPTDEVWLLGDVSFHKPPDTVELLARLNGHIHLIEGNHDRKRMNGKIKARFRSIQHYKELKHNGTKVVLSHYPFEDWNGRYAGSVHLHGHTHGSVRQKGLRRMDMAVDLHDFYPVNLDWCVAELEKMPHLDNDGQRYGV